MSAISFTPSQGSVSFLDGNVLDFTTVGAYCTNFSNSGRMNRIVPVYAPGENGAGTQNFIGGAQSVKIKVMYVNTSEGLCRTTFLTDVQNLAAGTFTMVADLDTYNGCYLESEPQAEQPRKNGVGVNYRMEASFNVRVARPT